MAKSIGNRLTFLFDLAFVATNYLFIYIYIYL